MFLKGNVIKSIYYYSIIKFLRQFYKKIRGRGRSADKTHGLVPTKPFNVI
jgi:hypothetical protein